MSLRQTFVKKSHLPFPAEFVFNWHLREGAFERLAPPWEKPRDLVFSGTIQDGGIASFTIPVGPFNKRWIARHSDFQTGKSFVDHQESGPFRYWRHTHSVIPETDQTCFLKDEIEYELPMGTIGRWFGSAFVRHKLEETFAYRHQITRADLISHTSVMKDKAMRILISGASGLVGTALTSFLKTGGHQVVPLRRATSALKGEGIAWDPAHGQIDSAQLNGFDAVIHLAGENIASGRWTAKRKMEIRRSRIEGTKLLSEALTRLEQPPQQFLCASAIGFYGPRGDEPLTESAAPGSGFLTDVCREWEAAADSARNSGINVTHLRFGIILSPEGGALAKMLLPFRMGAGGILGSGDQYMSWITLDDVIGAIHHNLAHPELTGPINVTAPTPVTNREFTKTLGKVLHRPTIFPVPAFGARIAFGEMADALLLTGNRVIPEKLQNSNYTFHHPDLESGLRHLLGKRLG